MFDKITGVKCGALDYYILSAIFIHVIILLLWLTSRKVNPSLMEPFEPENDIPEEYLDEEYLDEEYDDYLDYSEDYPMVVDEDYDMGMYGLTSGMLKTSVLSIILFIFVYMFTQGIYLKLLCKNNMKNSAWFIVLSPLISCLVLCIIQLIM